MTTYPSRKHAAKMLAPEDLLAIRYRPDLAPLEHAKRDREELLAHIEAIGMELTEARLSAQEAWEHTDDLMEMCENDMPDDDAQEDVRRANDWVRGVNFALHYVGGSNLLNDVNRYNPFLNPLEG